jgi:flagellar hook-length control protein FliK
MTTIVAPMPVDSMPASPGPNANSSGSGSADPMADSAGSFRDALHEVGNYGEPHDQGEQGDQDGHGDAPDRSTRSSQESASGGSSTGAATASETRGRRPHGASSTTDSSVAADSSAAPVGLAAVATLVVADAVTPATGVGATTSAVDAASSVATDVTTGQQLPSGSSGPATTTTGTTGPGTELTPAGPTAPDAADGTQPPSLSTAASPGTVDGPTGSPSPPPTVSTVSTTTSSPVDAARGSATTTEHLTAQPDLSAAFATLRNAPNGSVALTVALHPADLGAVQIHATLHDGTLNVTVACADDASRRAVTAALPELHAQLGNSAHVDVQLGDSSPSPNGNGPRTRDDAPMADYARPNSAASGDDVAAAPTSIRTAGGNRALDRWM